MASAASAAASASTATTKAAEATVKADSISSADFVDTSTAQTITGVKTMTAPVLVASIPAATFGPDLTPASLGGWTLAGGATWAAPNLSIPSGGSVSCTIPVVSGQTYQLDVTRSASSGGDMTVTIGAASISVPPWSNNRVTVVAAATGTLTLTVGGGAWAATVQSVVCREVTATAGPVGSPGASQLRSSSSNVASGYNAQRSLTTGGNNVATGHGSQFSLTTGSSNVASGHNSQYGPRGVTAWATTTASRQTSVGHESGQGSSTPSDDIVTVGYRAIADGAKAMALGSMASAAHAGSVALGSDVTTTATGQVAVGARDVEVQDATKGLVLRSPDGSRWRATINNTGVTAWTKIV